MPTTPLISEPHALNRALQAHRVLTHLIRVRMPEDMLEFMDDDAWRVIAAFCNEDELSYNTKEMVKGMFKYHHRNSKENN